MPSLTILHTNDIHGRIEGLARIATFVEQIRAAQPDRPVLYVDAGDSEETANRLSNLTKGTAMHRLLSAAGCDAATVGNAAPLRYGHQVLLDHAASALGCWALQRRWKAITRSGSGLRCRHYCR